MHRTVVNVQTGETIQVNLTAEEIAETQAATVAWQAGEAAKTPLTLEQSTFF